MPYLIGGSADLAGSNAPPILKGRGTIGVTEGGADFYAGTNIHFGVREHAMAAITNGIALDGTLRPYCGTFLIFSDYLRPSLRLAALMGMPSLFVFTHDSIYLGEDGPTHQPIEHLDALRAIPGLQCSAPPTASRRRGVCVDRAAHRGPVAARALAAEAARARAVARAAHDDVARGAYAVRDPATRTWCWWRADPRCRSPATPPKSCTRRTCPRAWSRCRVSSCSRRSRRRGGMR